ncbi:HAD family phosphatase [Microtetraspora sp. NBRC 16547]|uniref:HAD family hydrolase n=1 Tax=Microtetraspora sp. NBRC 16547 TaxID=3030993 RepID=UPI0024A0FACB|nr:HAD family phosphatase [Microtetraspora sp. NBRC 16547]GLW99062.1 hydrolase [Microtetraspora sp. NBRC 16547]
MRRRLPAAVLFDMDGTLVDTERLWWAAVEQVAAGMGRPLTEADMPDVVGRPAAHTAAHLHRTGARLHRTGGPSAGDPGALAAELDTAFAARVTREVVPCPGVPRLLDELAAAGVPMAIVSASPRLVVDVVRDVLGANRFALTVAAEDTVRSKPAPDPYLAASAALGVDPRACVAVEDSPTGIASAEAAGCAVLAVTSTVRIRPAARRTVLDSLEPVDLALLASLTAPAERK